MFMKIFDVDGIIGSFLGTLLPANHYLRLRITYPTSPTFYHPEFFPLTYKSSVAGVPSCYMMLALLLLIVAVSAALATPVVYDGRVPFSFPEANLDTSTGPFLT